MFKNLSRFLKTTVQLSVTYESQPGNITYYIKLFNLMINCSANPFEKYIVCTWLFFAVHNTTIEINIFLFINFFKR